MTFALDLERNLAELEAANNSVELIDEFETNEESTVIDTSEFEFTGDEPEPVEEPVAKTPEADALTVESEFEFTRNETPAKVEEPVAELPKIEAPKLRLVDTTPKVVMEDELSNGLDLVQHEKGLARFDENTSAIPAALLKQLASEDDTVRSAALADISRFGGEDAFNVISNSFDDLAAKVRNAAVRALYNLDTDCAVSFTRALREGSPKRRSRIGKAIAESGLAQDVLRDLVGESRERTYGAFSLLFLMVKAGEVGPLVHAIEEHQSVEVRLTAITLLVNSGHPEVAHLFRRVAVRGSLPPEVRSAAMEALHQLGPNSQPRV
jgi:hypothetical protein